MVAYNNEEEGGYLVPKVAEANQRNAELTLKLYDSGLADYTQVLQSKDTWACTSLSVLATSDQALTIDLIVLYKALGGDWACF